MWLLYVYMFVSMYMFLQVVFGEHLKVEYYGDKSSSLFKTTQEQKKALTYLCLINSQQFYSGLYTYTLPEDGRLCFLCPCHFDSIMLI